MPLPKHLLSADYGRRLAVVVNDFAALNVDASLVRNLPADLSVRLGTCRSSLR